MCDSGSVYCLINISISNRAELLGVRILLFKNTNGQTPLISVQSFIIMDSTSDSKNAIISGKVNPHPSVRQQVSEVIS